MRAQLIAASLVTLTCASAAKSQAVSTIGSSAAQSCYEAARSGSTGVSSLNECDKALNDTLSPSDRVATYVNRGILHALRREYAKSEADYDSAIKLGPSEPETFLNKGLLLLRMPSRTAEAAEFLSIALAKKTKMPALALYARAVAHEQLGQTGAAYRDYQQAAALAPTWQLPLRELRRFRTKT